MIFRGDDFSIYYSKSVGDVAGLYDFSPPDCAMKRKTLDTLKYDQVSEIDCPVLTPKAVLKKERQCFTNSQRHEQALSDHRVKSPKSNPITKPLPYNVMFATARQHSWVSQSSQVHG